MDNSHSFEEHYCRPLTVDRGLFIKVLQIYDNRTVFQGQIWPNMKRFFKFVLP
jgi:hypothetical protein